MPWPAGDNRYYNFSAIALGFLGYFVEVFHRSQYSLPNRFTGRIDVRDHIIDMAARHKVCLIAMLIEDVACAPDIFLGHGLKSLRASPGWK
jgi:hypothetical protein